MIKQKRPRNHFVTALAYMYTPILMLIVYYILPNGKKLMEESVSYELWYVLVAILLFSFTISPLLKAIEQYRSRKYAME